MTAVAAAAIGLAFAAPYWALALLCFLQSFFYYQLFLPGAAFSLTTGEILSFGLVAGWIVKRVVQKAGFRDLLQGTKLPLLLFLGMVLIGAAHGLIAYGGNGWYMDGVSLTYYALVFPATDLYLGNRRLFWLCVLVPLFLGSTGAVIYATHSALAGWAAPLDINTNGA